jgi:hypothetical protein
MSLQLVSLLICSYDIARKLHFSVSSRDTPPSVARVHEYLNERKSLRSFENERRLLRSTNEEVKHDFLNERQMQVRNIDDVDYWTRFHHTCRLGASKGGRIIDTMAQLTTGQTQHEVVLHHVSRTPARLRQTAERIIRWTLSSTTAGFEDMKETMHAFSGGASKRLS